MLKWPLEVIGSTFSNYERNPAYDITTCCSELECFQGWGWGSPFITNTWLLTDLRCGSSLSWIAQPSIRSQHQDPLNSGSPYPLDVALFEELFLSTTCSFLPPLSSPSSQFLDPQENHFFWGSSFVRVQTVIDYHQYNIFSFYLVLFPFSETASSHFTWII